MSSCRPTSASATRSPDSATTPRGDRRQRPLATVALLRAHAPLEHPHAPDPHTLPRRRTDMSWTVIDSPVGELRLVEHDGAVTAIEFSPFRPSEPRRPPPRRPRRRPAGPRRDRAPAAGLLRPRPQGVRPPAGAGRHRLPADACGTQLREVGFGETASYGQIAHRLGMTNAASRAVGLANGRNPIPIVIPCHRIIGANGTLTGYAGGLERKQRCSSSSRTRCSECGAWAPRRSHRLTGDSCASMPKHRCRAPKSPVRPVTPATREVRRSRRQQPDAATPRAARRPRVRRGRASGRAGGRAARADRRPRPRR